MEPFALERYALAQYGKQQPSLETVSLEFEAP